MIRRPPRSTLFPTRRSSDLGGVPPRDRVADRNHPSLVLIRAPLQVRQFFLKTDEALAQLEKDRKSTRLNSSHLVISYAVFCLKKNNSYFAPNLYDSLTHRSG